MGRNPFSPYERAWPCPACGVTLRRWALGSLQLDGCDGCGGLWFDAHELSAASQVEGDALEALEAQFTPGLAGPAGEGESRRCPACAKPLEPFSFPHAPSVRLDGCRTCGGIFLDDGELEALARTLPRRQRPARRAPEQRAAVAVGMLKRIACPSCGTSNPDLAQHCIGCGELLHRPPAANAATAVEELARHTLRLGWVLRELALFVLVGYLAAHGWTHRGYTTDLVPQPWKAPIVIGLAGLYVARWLWRKVRVIVRGDGLDVRYVLFRRFVRWDSIVGGSVFDLGSRAIWGVGDSLSGFGGARYGGSSMIAASLAHIGPELETPGRALMVLHTTHGPICFGPDLSRHMELLDRIRAHL